MRVGLPYSRIRTDEKLLLAALREADHEVARVDVRRQVFDLDGLPDVLADCDVVLDRCLASSQSRYVSRFCATHGVPVVNDPATAETCSDKVSTSLALEAAGVPTPKTTVAFSEEAALEAIEAFGYPCVLKPVVGSWGRLLAKIDSRSAAEAIVEHKATLGHYEHKVFYLQEYVEKGDGDVRVLAADGEPIAAMSRSSEHWLTNASTGAETAPFDVDAAAAEVVAAASDAVGGGLLGVDLMATADGYVCHEVNHTPEFTALDGTVDVDVPAAVVEWLEATHATEVATA